MTNNSNQLDYPCPCCGFIVFSEPPGSYGICPVCGWEDDHVQLRFPSMQGGANGISLMDHQEMWLVKLPMNLTECKGIHRDPSWRPLGLEDCLSEGSAPQSGFTYFVAAGGESPPYYWRKQ